MEQLSLLYVRIHMDWLWTQAYWVYANGTESLIWEGLTDKFLGSVKLWALYGKS